MAGITGHDGSVTYAAGYTTNTHAWRVTDGGDTILTTPFAPAGDSVTRAAAISNWEGEYRTWQPGTVNTGLTMAGGYYVTNAHSYSLEITAEDLMTTPFGADYNTRISGLLSATGSYECYIDDTTTLPVRGTTDTITLTIDTGKSYEIPILIASVDVPVSADGGDRVLTVNWESSGNFTETGAVPLIASTGAAIFVAAGARQYSGTILVIRLGISQTATRDSAEWTIGFVGSGDNTAA